MQSLFRDVSTTRPISIQSFLGRMLWDIGAWLCLRACRIDARTLWQQRNDTIESILDVAANREKDLFPLQTAYKWHPIYLGIAGLLPAKLAHARMRCFRKRVLCDLATMKLPPEALKHAEIYCEASQSFERAIHDYYFLPNVPSDLSLLASGIRACSAGEMPEVPKGQGLGRLAR
jgi:hypothetical protein